MPESHQEQNQFVESAHLNDLADKMKEMAAHPETFDANQLRADYEARLATALGNRQLNDSEFRLYQEAKAKITENIQQLVQLCDYLKLKTTLTTVDSYVSAGGLNGQDFTEVKQQQYMNDLSRLEQLLNSKSKPALLDNETWFNDTTKAQSIRNKLAGFLRNTITEQTSKVGEEDKIFLERQVQDCSINQTKTLTLNGYSNLEMSADTLSDLIRDLERVSAIDNQTGSVELSLEAARSRLKEMRSLLMESVKYLKPEDRFAVQNELRSSRAVREGVKGAREWNEAALTLREVRRSKEEALSAKRKASLVGAEQNLSSQAQALFTQAETLSATDHKQAAELYRKSTALYRQANEQYLATHQGPQTPNDPKIASR